MKDKTCACPYPHVIAGIDYCQKCGKINRPPPPQQSSEGEIEVVNICDKGLDLIPRTHSGNVSHALPHFKKYFNDIKAAIKELNR